MGKIKFAHDSDLPYISTFRLFLIIAVFTFVVYLIPGLFGAPLKGLSALLPSQETSWFNKKQLISETKMRLFLLFSLLESVHSVMNQSMEISLQCLSVLKVTLILNRGWLVQRTE